MGITDLIDSAKNRIGATSDYALAKTLGVSRATVSFWRTGTYTPDPVSCEKLANLSGIPLHQVLGIVGEARAKNEAEKRVWRKLAGAALLAGIVLFSAAPVWAATASVHYVIWLWRVTMRVTFSARLTHRRPPNTNAGTLRPAWT